MKGLAGLSIAMFTVLIAVPQVNNAAVIDDLGDSVKMVRQNSRTLEKATDAINACTTKVKNGDLSVSVCDSILQKFIIDVAKWLDENRLPLEDLIYPMTVPDNVYRYTNSDSARVTGTDDFIAIGEHTEIGVRYASFISQFSDECASRINTSDLAAVRPCTEISQSLNDHFRDFNENVKAEYDIIGTGSGLGIESLLDK